MRFTFSPDAKREGCNVQALVRCLDLFCCAGGAGEGYRRAGFDVTGVDIRPQPHNPHRFIQGDALAFLREHGHEFDFIHASPPCQAHTAMKTMWNAKKHDDLIGPTRDLLLALGKPFVIENVEGAPLCNPIRLCGTMFNLGVGDAELRRHRLFEIGGGWEPVFVPECQHGRRSVVGVYGGHCRNRQRVKTIGVYGKAVRKPGFHRGKSDWNVTDGRAAMGIDWMTLAELCQAIPPAYTEWIARQWCTANTNITRAASASVWMYLLAQFLIILS
jgi:DNA (cytosine-5)-methyltransferase 1